MAHIVTSTEALATKPATEHLSRETTFEGNDVGVLTTVAPRVGHRPTADDPPRRSATTSPLQLAAAEAPPSVLRHVLTMPRSRQDRLALPAPPDPRAAAAPKLPTPTPVQPSPTTSPAWAQSNECQKGPKRHAPVAEAA